MSLVIDASTALKWVLDEEGADAALALQGADLTAPSLWLVEAANALWRRSRNGEFSETKAAELLADLTQAPVVAMPLEPDLGAALTLAHLLGHPIYDCLYLAAAIRLGTFVVTSDRRFAEVARRGNLAGRVKLLGVDYPAASSR